MSRIMITNGGPHPPEKWAMMTAERIFEIAPTLSGERLIQAQSFQLTIAERLLPHYSEIQHDERIKLDRDVGQMLLPFEIDHHVDAIIADIVQAAVATPWQAHFANPTVQAAAREIIATDIATEQHVERLWYADHQPDAVESKLYSETFKTVL